MIVCHCFCVTDREIRRCAREGARSASEVGQACGAGTGCGGCGPEIASIVETDAHANRPAATSALMGLSGTTPAR
jgi:bacterioferritin-associated ferredoxin